MKARKIVIAMLAAGLAAVPSVAAAQTPAKPEARADMGMTSEQMKKMHAQMDEIRQTQDPEERQRLLAEHRKSMQEAMHRMRGMGGGMGHGMRGGMGPEERMQAMEQRMDMMQMMMEHMMQREQMMQSSPRVK